MAKRRGAIVPYSGRSYIEPVIYITLSTYTLHHKFCLEVYRYNTKSPRFAITLSDCPANSLVGDKAKARTPSALLSDSLDHSLLFFFFSLGPTDRGYVTSQC